MGSSAFVYERRRPEKTALYELVRDNPETLYGAMDDGALEVRLPKHQRKELEATSIAVFSAEASHAFDVERAMRAGSLRSRVKVAASARRAWEGACARRRQTSSSACCRRCRSGNGCRRFRFRGDAGQAPLRHA